MSLRLSTQKIKSPSPTQEEKIVTNSRPFKRTPQPSVRSHLSDIRALFRIWFQASTHETNNVVRQSCSGGAVQRYRSINCVLLRQEGCCTRQKVRQQNAQSPDLGWGCLIRLLAQNLGGRIIVGSEEDMVIGTR
jgi:hypothetical protein